MQWGFLLTHAGKSLVAEVYNIKSGCESQCRHYVISLVKLGLIIAGHRWLSSAR